MCFTVRLIKLLVEILTYEMTNFHLEIANNFGPISVQHDVFFKLKLATLCSVMKSIVDERRVLMDGGVFFV